MKVQSNVVQDVFVSQCRTLGRLVRINIWETVYMTRKTRRCGHLCQESAGIATNEVICAQTVTGQTTA